MNRLFVRKFEWDLEATNKLLEVVQEIDQDAWRNNKKECYNRVSVEFKEFYPDCKERSSVFTRRVKRLLDQIDQDSKEREKKTTSVCRHSWNEVRMCKLLDLGREVKEEEVRLKYTSFYVHKRGRKSNFYKNLHKAFLNFYGLNELAYSVQAITNAYNRAKKKFKEPEVLTEYDVGLYESDQVRHERLLKVWQTSHAFSGQKIFDYCCAFCGCLLY